MPARDARKRVTAQQQAQRALLADLGPQAEQGIDHVGRTGSLKLTGIHTQPRLIGHRESQHGEAMRAVGNRACAVRGIGVWNQSNFRPQCIARRKRQGDVCAVYRIECATEDNQWWPQRRRAGKTHCQALRSKGRALRP